MILQRYLRGFRRRIKLKKLVFFIKLILQPILKFVCMEIGPILQEEIGESRDVELYFAFSASLPLD